MKTQVIILGSFSRITHFKYKIEPLYLRHVLFAKGVETLMLMLILDIISDRTFPVVG
jgi:hypothetical protein